MNDVKYEDGKLIVSTPKGDIVVSVDGDCGYPGISVDFKSNDIKESALMYAYDEIPLARIEYGIEDKELRTYLWEVPGKEEPSYKATYNDSLTFDEDFEILEEGTKIEYNGQVAYITGDDRENCPEGYHDSLNYYIKYALEDETYDGILERINKEEWYDEMILWSWAKVI